MEKRKGIIYFGAVSTVGASTLLAPHDGTRSVTSPKSDLARDLEHGGCGEGRRQGGDARGRRRAEPAQGRQVRGGQS